MFQIRRLLWAGKEKWEDTYERWTLREDYKISRSDVQARLSLAFLGLGPRLRQLLRPRENCHVMFTRTGCPNDVTMSPSESLQTTSEDGHQQRPLPISSSSTTTTKWFPAKTPNTTLIGLKMLLHRSWYVFLKTFFALLITGIKSQSDYEYGA